MNDLVVSNSAEPVPSPGDGILSVIAAAAKDPNVDVPKMQQLLEMYERIKARDAETAFTEAMTRVQASVPRIVKDRKIVVKGTLRSKYAALEDIDKKVRPLVLAEGFSLMYTTEDVPPKATRLILTIKHRQGHKEAFTLALPLDNNEFRSPSQNAASTVSFGRRVLLCMALNIVTVDEDLDGNEGAMGLFISEEQELNILDALQDLGIKPDDEKLLAWIGTDSIKHIQRAGYERVMQMLDKRRAAR